MALSGEQKIIRPLDSDSRTEGPKLCKIIEAQWRSALFEAIGRDPRSPWRGWGPYLAARAALRQASEEDAPAAYANAHRTISGLAAAPSDALERDKAAGLADALAFSERPPALWA